MPGPWQACREGVRRNRRLRPKRPASLDGDACCFGRRQGCRPTLWIRDSAGRWQVMRDYAPGRWAARPPLSWRSPRRSRHASHGSTWWPPGNLSFARIMGPGRCHDLGTTLRLLCHLGVCGGIRQAEWRFPSSCASLRPERGSLLEGERRRSRLLPEAPAGVHAVSCLVLQASSQVIGTSAGPWADVPVPARRESGARGGSG